MRNTDTVPKMRWSDEELKHYCKHCAHEAEVMCEVYDRRRKMDLELIRCPMCNTMNVEPKGDQRMPSICSKCGGSLEILNIKGETVVVCSRCWAEATLVWKPVKKILASCPFCGNSRDVNVMTENDFTDYPVEEPMYTIVCCTSQHPGDDSMGCGASSGYFSSLKEAIDAWNTRQLGYPYMEVE